MYSTVKDDFFGVASNNQVDLYQPRMEEQSDCGPFLREDRMAPMRDLGRRDDLGRQGDLGRQDAVPALLPGYASSSWGSEATRVAAPAVDAAAPSHPAPGPGTGRDRSPGVSPADEATAAPVTARRSPPAWDGDIYDGIGWTRFGERSGHDATGAVDSRHLRAARALLGWAMSDLATVSGLSLSTVRRLEQSTEAVSPRNHRAAVDALRLGGVRFLTLDDGTTALAEHPPRPAPLPPGDAAGRRG